MENTKPAIRRIYIIGMGALGMLYGNYLTEHYPEGEVAFLMDENRYARHSEQIHTINGKPVTFPIVTPSRAQIADLIIFAVKHHGLQSAIALAEPAVGPQTVILSVMNGISSENEIGAVYGEEKMIYTVAQGMDAMRFGNDLHFTQIGDLHIGIAYKFQADNLEKVEELFQYIGLPYVSEKNIRHRLWSKFMLNVAVNQTCMVYNQTYGEVLSSGESNQTMIAAMREVITLANLEGVYLTEKDINDYLDILRTLDAQGMPSMAQDRVNQKPSEVDIFSGAVIAMAQKWHVYVPVNQFLYDRILDIEKGYLPAHPKQ